MLEALSTPPGFTDCLLERGKESAVAEVLEGSDWAFGDGGQGASMIISLLGFVYLI